MTKKTFLDPDELFAQALSQYDRPLKDAEKRLLMAGADALRLWTQKPLAADKLESLKALIAYTAYKQAVPQELVESILLSTFEAASLKDLSSANYQRIVAFLVDCDVKKIVN